MTNQELVELLRDKAGVSYEEAQDALERANWDPLDAVLLLEQAERTRMGGGEYSTKAPDAEEERDTQKEHKGAREAGRWLGRTIRKLVRIGNANHFVVTRKGCEVLSLPVTAFAVLLICLFWCVAVVLVVGLFCGLRYSFRGPNLGKQAINDAINRAADMAESVREDLMRDGE